MRALPHCLSHLPRHLLPAPLSVGLAAATLAVWANLTLCGAQGVQVLNHSGQVLRGVQVCVSGGRCVSRPALWPHQAWQVPLPSGQAGRVLVRAGNRQATSVLPGMTEHAAAVQFVVRPGGDLETRRQTD